MDRRLYVYYRVPQATLAATLLAVRAMQAALVAAHPGLRAQLMRRPEAREGGITLMEAYAGAVSPALEAALAERSRALPQPRHNEYFESA